MKPQRFLVILLIVVMAAPALSQTPSNIVLSDPFILKAKTDQQPPRLTLVEPRLEGYAAPVVESNVLIVKGVATDESGIKKIEVNGITTQPSATGGFALKVPLREGMNNVSLRAEDNCGNDTTARFSVMCDTRPPVIVVLEPKVEVTRGIQVVAAPSNFIRGKAFDENGVREFTINGVPVTLGADSVFRTELPPKAVPDTVSLVAVDNAGRRTTRVVIVPPAKPVRPDFLTSKSYALVIGIDTYKGKWPPLQNAVRDAKAVAEMLTNKFEFEVIHTLYDQEATRDNVLSMLDRLAEELGPDDNLLIFFSGHGRKEPPLNKGYWVPVDATERSIGRYISNREIQDYLAAMKAKHVLLVADACFAGDIFKGNTLKYPFEDNDNYYRKVAEKKSRDGLTSGGDEPVLDGGANGHSLFAWYFLQSLDGIKKNYFSAEEVYQELKIPVANNSDQTPTFLPIKNTDDAGGQFIFVRR